MKACILLIDDDEDELFIFNEAIKEITTDIQCVYAKDAETGIEMLAQISPLIIFVDFNMPRINGIECLGRIRKLQHYSGAPLILYSNGADDILSQKAMDAGASSCVKKPIKFSVLLDLLKEIVPGIKSGY